MLTDPISDYLTRMRNAMMVNHDKVSMPSSNMKKSISDVLLEKGYINGYKILQDEKKKYGGQDIIEIQFKYSDLSAGKKYAIEKLERVSKPGLRKYFGVKEVPNVLNGLGIAILSTSKGVISDKEARKQNVGGEILCYVY